MYSNNLYFKPVIGVLPAQNVSKSKEKEFIEKMHSAVYKILSAAMRLSFNNEVKKKNCFGKSREKQKKN